MSLHNFIHQFPNVLSKDRCQEIIDTYLKDSATNAKRADANLHGVVKEWSPADGEFWDTMQDEVEALCWPHVDQYLSYSNLLNRNSYYLKHMTIMHHRELINIPYHYDAELSYMDGQEYIRNFAILIYLNENFENGELMFPVQKVAIKPKAGLGLIFPTSFMYPHVTNPAIGSDRYVLRLGYFFKKEGIIESVKKSKDYY